MANNGVSQHFKIDKGLDLVSDSQFATLGANEKIVYKPSGEKYIKNPNYSNVFDKTDTFGDLEADIKSKAVRKIENSGLPDGTTNYYSIDGTKLGSFISGVSPNDLGAVKSSSVSSIDDANASGVCSCKNTSGAQIDTFTCHVSKSANNPALSWGSEAIIGTVDGTTFKVTMPAGYSAGTGLTLSGTTFSISQGLIDKISDSLPIGSYIQFAGSQAPAGFLVCNGGAVSRTTYAKLFAVIGTTYGSGDGSTTFNLPNLTDRFLQGSASVGTVKEAGLPNIAGGLRITTIASFGVKSTGCFNHDAAETFAASGNHYGTNIDFNASRSSSIYGNSSTVQPPALTCLICIKY